MVVRREGGGDAHLCALRHRQLSSDHRQDLYRPFVLHLRSGPGRDAARLFNFISGYAQPEDLEKLALSPINLKAALARNISTTRSPMPRPAGPRRSGASSIRWSIPVSSMRFTRPARPACRSIWWCAASAACGPASGAFRKYPGQKHRRALSRTFAHRLLRRGPGLPHTKAMVYIGSADWMQRNLHRRVETLIPIENPTVHDQILDQIMMANFRDNQQSWDILPDGGSRADRARCRNEAPFNAHEYFMNNPSLSGRGSSLAGNVAGKEKKRAKAQQVSWHTGFRTEPPNTGRLPSSILGRIRCGWLSMTACAARPRRCSTKRFSAASARVWRSPASSLRRHHAGACGAAPFPGLGQADRRAAGLCGGNRCGARGQEWRGIHRPGREGPRRWHRCSDRQGGGALCRAWRDCRYSRSRRHGRRSGRRLARTDRHRDGKMRDGMTLPIGPLRLIDMSGGSIEGAGNRRRISRQDKSRELKGRTFYAVGGTWRNLARIYMAQTHYPLHVLHRYSMTRQQAKALPICGRPLVIAFKDVHECPGAVPTPCRTVPWCSSACWNRARPKMWWFGLWGARGAALFQAAAQKDDRMRCCPRAGILPGAMPARPSMNWSSATGPIRFLAARALKKPTRNAPALCRLPAGRYRLARPSRLPGRALAGHDLAGRIRRY